MVNSVLSALAAETAVDAKQANAQRNESQASLPILTTLRGSVNFESPPKRTAVGVGKAGTQAMQ